jgi:hypothetical protein
MDVMMGGATDANEKKKPKPGVSNLGGIQRVKKVEPIIQPNV